MADVFMAEVKIGSASQQSIQGSIQSKLMQLVPSLAERRYTTTNHPAQHKLRYIARSESGLSSSLFTGVCDDLLGMQNLDCSLVMYADEDKSPQFILVVSTNAPLSLDNVPVLQGKTLSMLRNCISLSASGKVVVSSVAIPELALVAGVNMAFDPAHLMFDSSRCSMSSIVPFLGLQANISMGLLASITQTSDYYTGNAYIDIHSGYFAITGAGSVGLQLRDFVIFADNIATNSFSVSVGGEVMVELPQTTASFYVNGTYQSRGELQLRGECAGWPNLLGITGFNIGTTVVDIFYQSKTSYDVNIRGSISLHLSSSTSLFNLSAQATPRGSVFMAQTTLSDVLNIVCHFLATDSCVTNFNSFGFTNPDLTLTISTAEGLPLPDGSGGFALYGMLFEAETVIIDPLLSRIRTVLKTFPSNTALRATIHYPWSLIGASIGLQVQQQFELSSAITIANPSIAVHPFDQFRVEMSAELTFNFELNNGDSLMSTLRFKASCEFVYSGDVTLTAVTLQPWENVLGFNALTFSHINAEIVIDTVQARPKYVEFSVQANIAHFTFQAQGFADTMSVFDPKLCFQVSLGRFTLGDIADMINALFNLTLSLGKELSAVALQVDKLTMSTFTGSVNWMTCQQGLVVDASLEILGWKTFDWSFSLPGDQSSVVDLGFDLPLLLLDLIVGLFIDVEDVWLADLSIVNLARGKNPYLCVKGTELTIWGWENFCDCYRVPFLQLLNGFVGFMSGILDHNNPQYPRYRALSVECQNLPQTLIARHLPPQSPIHPLMLE